MHRHSISVLALAVASLAAMPAFASDPAEAAPTPAATPDPTPNDVVVTGTRTLGVTAVESAVPVKLFDEATLSRVGQPNLNQVLTQLVPSFTAQAFGGDTANLTLSARLRGLSPNHTLVLVNGKRRHGTANLAVLGGPYQGAATADLDLISPSSIKRIEVLEDGAAAQYGSDAIAGVINIILKDDNEGGSGYGTYGKTYGSGGMTYAGTLHLASKIGEDGFVNITLFHRYHDFTQVGGIDRRVTDINGTLLSSLSAVQKALYATIPGFPFTNKINGDARSYLTNVQFNAGYDFGGVEAYSFGTYSKRIASAYENLRVPDRIIASAVLGVGGTLGAPGSIVFDPEGDSPSNGFSPREGIREDDFSVTGGLRGDLAGFHFDLSGTYGQDKNLVYTLDSANRSLFIDTHFTPTTFYDGLFKSSELTLNADFTREIETGMAAPINVAFGAEYRRNRYEIGSGDAGSIYKEGGQSYPGFRPSDAGVHSRIAKSLYLDIAAKPVEALKLDAAVRYEHYSDFGSKVIWKLTGRYDFSSAFALRGTVATGFRAPTLAESYYSATNVSPTSAFVQLPANSAAAKLLGFQNLQPEKSTNFSFGTVIRPAARLIITLDAYQVKIRDRILGTGSIFGSGGAINFAAVTNAIVANGNILDPTVTQTGINIFTNGADTRTRGVDLVMSYLTDFGEAGKVSWTLSGNYNETKVTRIGLAPVALTAPGATSPIALFDQGAISNLQTASPKVKFIASAVYSLRGLTLTLRETIFGKTSADYSSNGDYTPANQGITWQRNVVKSAPITDVEASYEVSGLTFTVGANNLFNKKAPTIALLTNGTPSGGGNVFDAPLGISPYGINGGYYYVRVGFKF